MCKEKPYSSSSATETSPPSSSRSNGGVHMIIFASVHGGGLRVQGLFVFLKLIHIQAVEAIGEKL
jgi:hypothetical protein